MCDKKCPVNVGIISNDVRISSNVTVERNCAGFIAINKGDVVVRVNGIELLPAPGAGLSGEAFGVECNEGEVFTDVIRVQFDTLAGNPFVTVVQKYYK